MTVLRYRGLSQVVSAVLVAIIGSSAGAFACGGSCGGCAPYVTPVVNTARNAIETKYDAVLAAISAKYDSEIAPLEEDLRKLEHETSVVYGRLEGIERENLKLDMMIAYEMRLIRQLEATNVPISKTNKDKEN